MLIALDGYFISKSFILHVVVRLSEIEQTQAIFWYCILRIYFLCGKIKKIKTVTCPLPLMQKLRCLQIICWLDF